MESTVWVLLSVSLSHSHSPSPSPSTVSRAMMCIAFHQPCRRAWLLKTSMKSWPDTSMAESNDGSDSA
eukprot:4268544-Prorocentrum_lima.AAC.1